MVQELKTKSAHLDRIAWLDGVDPDRRDEARQPLDLERRWRVQPV